MSGGGSDAEVPRINVFEVDGTYIFKQYFEEKETFNRLKRHYNSKQYRFEVPGSKIEHVLTYLSQEGYRMVVVDDAIEEYVLVVRKYTDHPEGVFKKSVMLRKTVDYNCFLMRNKAAVEEGLESGGRRLSDMDIQNPF